MDASERTVASLHSSLDGGTRWSYPAQADPGALLSIVIPVRRDPRVDSSVSILLAWGRAQERPLEILVCGEPLSGQTVAGARFLRVVPAQKGACVAAGVLASHGSQILVCDADLPVGLDDIEKLVRVLDRCDLAVGQRHQEGVMRGARKPAARRAASAAFRFMALALFDLPAGSDSQCGVKAFRAPAARTLFRSLTVTGLAYDVEVLLKARLLSMEVRNVPLMWKHSNTTVAMLRDGARMCLDLIKLHAAIRQSASSRDRGVVQAAAQSGPSASRSARW
jgi:hypothetical protein